MTSVDQEIREQRELLAQMDRGDSAREEHEVTETTERSCRIEGCPHSTEVLKGRYGGLCAEHRKELADKIYGENRASRGGGAPRKAAANGSGVAGQIRALVPLAVKVDRTKARLDALPEASTQNAELDEAIRRVQGARTPENLAALIELTKAAMKSQAPRERLAKEAEEAERAFKSELAAVARRAAS